MYYVLYVGNRLSVGGGGGGGGGRGGCFSRGGTRAGIGEIPIKLKNEGILYIPR